MSCAITRRMVGFRTAAPLRKAMFPCLLAYRNKLPCIAMFIYLILPGNGQLYRESGWKCHIEPSTRRHRGGTLMNSNVRVVSASAGERWCLNPRESKCIVMMVRNTLINAADRVLGFCKTFPVHHHPWSSGGQAFTERLQFANSRSRHPSRYLLFRRSSLQAVQAKMATSKILLVIGLLTVTCSLAAAKVEKDVTALQIGVKVGTCRFLSLIHVLHWCMPL